MCYDLIFKCLVPSQKIEAGGLLILIARLVVQSLTSLVYMLETLTIVITCTFAQFSGQGNVLSQCDVYVHNSHKIYNNQLVLDIIEPHSYSFFNYCIVIKSGEKSDGERERQIAKDFVKKGEIRAIHNLFFYLFFSSTMICSLVSVFLFTLLNGLARKATSLS